MGQLYSAGIMKDLFWFPEQEKIVNLLHEGLTPDDIKAKHKQESLFPGYSENRSGEMLRRVLGRVVPLGDSYINLFLQKDVPEKKILVLASIMIKSPLFFEFMTEVIREKLFSGDTLLSTKDFSIFWTRLGSQNPKVASWSEGTLRNLNKAFVNFLLGSGYVVMNGNNKRLTPPMVDEDIHQWLLTHDYARIWKAMAGEM